MSWLCSCFGGMFTLKRTAPSLRAPRAETRLTVYRALRSFGLSRSNFRKCLVFAFKLFPSASICAKGRHPVTDQVSRAIRRLYESSGGNQVDGLPPAQHFDCKRGLHLDFSNYWLVRLEWLQFFDGSFGHSLVLSQREILAIT